MENNNCLNKVEIISIILMIMINKLILNVPYYIVNLTGNGSIINIVYIGIIDFIFLLIIIKLFNNFENADILDISEILGGKILKTIIGIACIILFLLVSFITLLDFSNVLHKIYFSDFSIIYILLFFIVGILVANLVGLKPIARTTTFVIPFAILSILITFFAVLKDLKLDTITPIFGESYYNTFVVGASNSFAMYMLIYIYFIKPLLKNPKDFKKISIISYIISLIILLLTVISMLTLFNSGSGNAPINSLFLLSRQIQLGTFVQRVDALFVLFWILSIFSYLSFVIFLINRIIKKLTNISNEKMISYSTCSILFGLSLIPLNIAQVTFIENIIYRYVILGFIFGIGLILLIFASIKNKIKKGNN
jgi:spore germination protein (amino acid permease)